MTELVRKELRSLIDSTTSAHPGLLLQCGWKDFVQTDSENAGAGGKTQHIRRICEIPSDDFYHHAFERWLTATSNANRFARCAMKIEGRLLIGLTGGGALETGCAVSQTYGTPYLPGSSIKGAVRAWAEKNLKEPDAQNYIFGVAPSEDNLSGLSGEIIFHDAWWIPDSGEGQNKKRPFAEDVVTPHHPEYYKDGNTPATDLDSPVPNAMIGVRGSFLFTLEGDPRWLNLASFMLKKALAENGIGAKNSAGYGYLQIDEKETGKLKKLADDANRAVMSFEDQFLYEVEGLTENKLIELFGKEINKTKQEKGENFELFSRIAKKHFSAQIETWQSVSKKSDKNRYKAFRFFSGAEDSE